MWGWVSRAAMSISRRNRSFPRAAPRSGLSIWRATRRRCFRSSARYPVAMPPRPSSRLIVYRSASATWSRPGTPLIRRKDTVGVGAQRAYGRGARSGLLISTSAPSRRSPTSSRQNAKAGELVLPGFGGVANDRLRRDLSRGGNIAFWLRPSQWSPDQRGCWWWDSNPQGLTPGDVRDLCVYRFRHTSTVTGCEPRQSRRPRRETSHALPPADRVWRGCLTWLGPGKRDSARIHAPWRRRIPYIAAPTLQAARDDSRPTPRRLLGGRRALPQGVRRQAQGTPGRARLVRAAARGGTDRPGPGLRPADHARCQRDQGAAPPDRRGPAGAARHGRPRHTRRRGGPRQDDRGEHHL